MDAHEKELRMKTAKIEDDVDSDFCYFDEKADELEAAVEHMKPGLVQEAVGFLIVQLYLRRMRRKWEDLEAEDDTARGGDDSE